MWHLLREACPGIKGRLWTRHLFRYSQADGRSKPGLVSNASRLSELLHQQMDQLSEKRTLLMYVMVGLFEMLFYPAICSLTAAS